MNFFLDYLITQIYLKTTQLDIQKTVLTLQSISFLRLKNKIKKKHMSRIQLRKWLHNVELQQIVIHMYTALWSVWCNTVWGQVQVLLWPFLSCGLSIKCIHSFTQMVKSHVDKTKIVHECADMSNKQCSKITQTAAVILYANCISAADMQCACNST